MRKSPAVSVTFFAVFALVLAGAAIAWACTAQPGLRATGPGGASEPSGPPGSQISVSASNFRQGPVEIRWNSQGGPILGVASGPAFTVGVTVPGDAPEGVHYLVGVQNVGIASAEFTVVGSSAASGTDANAAGGEPAADPATSNSVAGTDAPDPASETQRSGGSRGALESGGAAAESTGITSSNGTPIFTPSAAGSDAVQPSVAGKAGEPVRGDAGASRSVDEIASSDGLYSGLESPAVLPSPFDAMVGSEPTSALTMGVMLLAGGLVAMFAGVLVSEARRRRSAEAGRRTR